MDDLSRDYGVQRGSLGATVMDSNSVMGPITHWHRSANSTIGDFVPQFADRKHASTQSFSVHQASESLEGQEGEDEYDLFGITRSMDWLDADGHATPRGASPKPEEADFGMRTGPLSRLYLDGVAEDHQSCSDTSFHHLAATSYMFPNANPSGSAVLPCGASPAAHLLGRNTSGELQFLMDTEGDLCSPPVMLEHPPIHKPASSNSLADDCRPLYPSTPPQNILGKRDWMDPYHSSPQDSGASVFSSRSSVDNVHLLADVPDVPLDATFAPRNIHLPYGFERYSSLESCGGLDDLPPEEVLVGIGPLCTAPPTPLGMCYAPVPAAGRSSRTAASSPRASASPALSAPAAPAAPAESEGCTGVRQRACKRKVKYSDTEPLFGAASEGPRSLVTSARGRCSKPRRFFTAGADSDEEASEGSNKRRKHHNPWSIEETEALVVGVERCGGGKWADIKKLGFPIIAQRSAVDLKDKWRNLMRVALLPGTAAKTKIEKRREVPQDLLDRVRALSASFGSKASAAARPYLGRPRRSA